MDQRRSLVMLVMLVAPIGLTASALGAAHAQPAPDSVVRGLPSRQVETVYDASTDSTTRSLSAYVVVDTGVAPPDTFAVELTQRWRGRATVAPVAPVELAIAHARLAGLTGDRSLLSPAVRRPAIVFLLDGVRRIRLPQAEYVASGGATPTFETGRYRLAAEELRRIAEASAIRVWVGDRELWIDPAWRGVAAAMRAGQVPAGGRH